MQSWGIHVKRWNPNGARKAFSIDARGFVWSHSSTNQNSTNKTYLQRGMNMRLLGTLYKNALLLDAKNDPTLDNDTVARILYTLRTEMLARAIKCDLRKKMAVKISFSSWSVCILSVSQKQAEQQRIPSIEPIRSLLLNYFNVMLGVMGDASVQFWTVESWTLILDKYNVVWEIVGSDAVQWRDLSILVHVPTIIARLASMLGLEIATFTVEKPKEK
jgi:hypothetical protein